jgi:hypothetical protein
MVRRSGLEGYLVSREGWRPEEVAMRKWRMSRLYPLAL